MLVRYGIEIVAEFICENCTQVSLGALVQCCCVTPGDLVVGIFVMRRIGKRKCLSSFFLK